MTITMPEAGIILAVLGHGAATIWWASKMNTTMVFIRQDLDSFIDTQKDKSKTLDSEVKALWKRVDENRNKITALEASK